MLKSSYDIFKIIITLTMNLLHLKLFYTTTTTMTSILLLLLLLLLLLPHDEMLWNRVCLLPIVLFIDVGKCQQTPSWT